VKIISFDPAAKKNLGIAISKVSKKGKIKSIKAYTYRVPEADDWERPWVLYQYLDWLLTKEKPDVVVYERTDLFSGSKYIRSLITKCIAMIECACGKNKIKMAHFAPAAIKKRVTGNGRSSKEEVEGAVKSTFDSNGIKDKCDSEHAYDAVATAITYIEFSKEV